MLKIYDLIDISRFLAEKTIDGDVELTITVPNHYLLNKLNEEIYYYNNKDSKEIPADVEEINVNVGIARFKFISNE